MKKFFENYGAVALGILALLVLIAMITPVGNIIKTSLQGTVQTFSTRIEEQQTDTIAIDMGRFSNSLLAINMLEKGSGRIYSEAYGTCTFSENDNTYTIKKTAYNSANAYPYGLTFTTTFVESHKYFLMYDFKSTVVERTFWQWPGYGGSGDRTLGAYNNVGEWKTYTDILTATNTSTDLLILKQMNTQAEETRLYRNVQLYDLTEVYGVGNEPSSVEQVIEDLYL